MNTASQQTHSSLAQRLAKVRNCMLVELSTSVSPTDKDLFTSLCQTYEQNSVVTSSSTTASSENALHQAFSLSHLAQEGVLLHEIIATSESDASPRRYMGGFSMIKWPNFEDFADWDNTR